MLQIPYSVVPNNFTSYKNSGNVLYHLKKSDTADKNSSFRRTKQNRLVLVSDCAVCNKKKSGFIKND